MIEIQNEEIEMVLIRVAEKLGWRTLEYNKDGFLVGHPPGRKDIRVVPSYASDIKAAWEIVEMLKDRWITVIVANEDGKGRAGNYVVEAGDNAVLLARAEHHRASLAICLVFLGVPELRLQGLDQKKTGNPAR